MAQPFNHREHVEKERARKQKQQQQEAPKTNGAGPHLLAAPQILEALTVSPKGVTWMWYPYVPAGVITILGARGGSCKGLTSASLTASITTEGLWPDGSGPAPQGHVLWCEAEDPLPEVVVPRLIAAGANLANVSFANREAFANLDLRQLIQKRGTRLIVMSPMVSFLKLNDINSELGVREVLETLQAAIEGTNACVIGIAHTNKKADLAAIERILGSVAFANFVRSVLLTATEDVDDNTFRMAHAKHNISIKGDDLILKPVHVGEEPRSQYVKLHWSQPDANTDAEAMFDRKKTNGQEPKFSAPDWLHAFLKKNGESLRETVIIEAAEAGFKEAAIHKAQVRSRKLHVRREGFPAKSYWSLT